MIIEIIINAQINATYSKNIPFFRSSEKKIIMEVERPTRTLPPGQEDTPQFSDTHPLVNTPEYTPLVFKTKPCRRIIRSPSPHRDDCKQDKKGLKSIGICAALPMRRVRFFVSLY